MDDTERLNWLEKQKIGFEYYVNENLLAHEHGGWHYDKFDIRKKIDRAVDRQKRGEF